jgi:hypothetical protein
MKMKEWQQGFWYGVAATIIGSLISLAFMKPACAQTSWEQSPYNWKNSDMNYNNSSQNWNNSPQNYNNSQYNSNARNGVYDNSGNRIGYETISPSGTKNYYDNNGTRQGYTPYGR